MSESSRGRLLLVDDDLALAESLKDIFVDQGYLVTHAEDGDYALDLLEQQPFDTVISDFEMPVLGGMELLVRVHKIKPRLPVILMTAFSSTDRAIESTRQGAFDYLIKPVEIPELLETVAKAVATSRLSARAVEMGEDDASGKDCIIGTSKAMLQVFKEIGRIAPMPVATLIQGETGSGKELVARAICQYSDRAHKPFVAVNCAAIPETLIESELFGHEKGAFTNAIAQRIGRFEQAGGGTLFLDEIGDLPWETQVKLLRVLQEKVICRVGGRGEIPIDVRVISATHRDLPAMIGEGKFREDLYYRLNAATITLPPLRDRPGDIPLLLDYFLRRYAAEFKLQAPSIHPDAVRFLSGEPWPGNVRQLENVIRRALFEARGATIGTDLIRQVLAGMGPADAASTMAETAGNGLAGHVRARLLAASRNELEAGRGALEVLVEDLERELYAQAVQLSHGNQSRMSEWLGVSRLTIREKLDRFELFPKRKVTRKKPPRGGDGKGNPEKPS